ncbi:MAG: hypothetical protein BRC43_15330 [Cyanobacteria bacterium QS_3_48_167]|nr:MAG: hypothetical protein BRC43_15330 [Cyanobacteria bacterium QS_3_48_167]
MQVWRLSKRKYALTAFSGEGTQKVGGRWTPVGFRAVYTSSSLALAALELLVHASKEEIGKGFVAVSAEVPNHLQIDEISLDPLPDNWRETPAPIILSSFGQEWLASGQNAVLSIPSAVIPAERNFLLNPQHPQFAKIAINQPEPFTFDSRLDEN